MSDNNASTAASAAAASNTATATAAAGAKTAAGGTAPAGAKTAPGANAKAAADARAAEAKAAGAKTAPGANAAMGGAAPAPGAPEAPKKGRRLRAVLIPLALALVLAGCATGYYFYFQSTAYFVTDNAKVTAKMYSVFPVKQGPILEWNVASGDNVEKNQILGCQDIMPYITSPIDGLIVRSDAAVGQNASMSTPLAVIADTSEMYIGVNIEETDIIRIRPGQKATVTIDAIKGASFRGIVGEVDRATQTYFSNSSSFSTSGTYTKVTQLVPVKVYIENPDGLPLTYGMNATVKIALDR
ncbi:MAG: efflux RND transporter periplasmic adaptor subunit [Clostridiales Family XIII bacterium]|jgi:multidrug resistance efflux pump|nr:efflux RND transporter periplasmic adaptor subunit [Clostridiales Family XIII bacterium]